MAELIAVMEACPQTANQSVLDHGRAVVRHFDMLVDHLRNGSDLPAWWRVPAWTKEPGILERLYDTSIMHAYLEFHDCGKPSVRVVDDEGRQHFPEHAAASEHVWLSIGGDPQAARLMAMDMDAHLLKGDGIAEFASRPEAISLLLAAVAEVHSNAAMFGGTDSDSFKIKAKHLNKRGRQVLAAIDLMKSPSP